jgi:hypothetical protein
MHQRLIDKHKMSYEKLEWLPAWNLEIDVTSKK